MAGTPFGKLVVELGMNTAKFDEGIGQAQKQLRLFNKAIKGAAEEVKLYGKGSEAVTTQLTLIQKAYKGNEELLKQYRARLNETTINLKDSSIAVKANTEAYKEKKAALDEARKTEKNLVEQVKQAKNAIDSEKGATEEQAKALEDAEKALAEFNDELKKRVAEEKASREAVKTSSAEEKRYQSTLEKTKSQMVVVTGEMTRLKREYSELAKEQALANNKLVNFGTQLEEAGKKSTESGNKILNVSRAFAPLTAAIVGSVGAGMGVAIKAATDYETALKNVEKTTDPTEQQLQMLSKGFRDLAKEIPVSAASLAEMGSVAGQLGIHNDNLLGFVSTMAKLQTATNIVGEEGAKDIARFMNVMGTSQDKVSNLGSALVDLGNNFATSEREILDMATNLAGAGATANLTEGDVLGLSTALSSVGIEAEKGGSAMSKFIGYLKLGAETGQVGSVNFAEFAKVAGTSVESFSNLVKTDMASAIDLFLKGLNQMDKEGQSSLLTLVELGLNETRLKDTLLRASNTSDVFSGALRTGNKAFNENIALQREFNTFSQTTASKWELFKNKLTDVAIEMGNKLLPTLQGLLDNAGPFVDGIKAMIDGFNALPGPIKTALMALTGMTAAFSPVMGLIGQFKLFKGLIGETLGAFLKARGVAQVAGQSFDIVASAATGASGAFGSFGGTVGTVASAVSGLISLPVLAWVGGIAGALGLGFAAWKLWGESAWNAAQEVKRSEETVKQWGADVGKDVDTALDKMAEFGSKAQVYIKQGVTVNEETKNSATKAMSGMFDGMKEAVDSELKNMQENYQKMPDIQITRIN